MTGNGVPPSPGPDGVIQSYSLTCHVWRPASFRAVVRSGCRAEVWRCILPMYQCCSVRNFTLLWSYWWLCKTYSNSGDSEETIAHFNETISNLPTFFCLALNLTDTGAQTLPPTRTRTRNTFIHFTFKLKLFSPLSCPSPPTLFSPSSRSSLVF